MTDLPIDIHPEIAAALARGGPVVALETTVIAHGLPYPLNRDTATALEAVVRAAGAVPATLGVLKGRIKIGLDADQIEHFAQNGASCRKLSRRDLPVVLAEAGDGATTVAGTMILAELAGIRIMATGGIGGVHRGAEATMDVSADLTELARSNVAVICAGAKAILDLDKTLEYLETQGVPVIGYGTDRLPAFYLPATRHKLEARVDGPAAAARMIQAQRRLGLGGGLLFANPIPAEHALDPDVAERAIQAALAEAVAHGIAGKEVTPFLLARMEKLTEGRSVAANAALIRNNARVAAEIAVAYARLGAGAD
jgi:pseudouridine-5'-phosphate glycosidase